MSIGHGCYQDESGDPEVAETLGQFGFPPIPLTWSVVSRTQPGGRSKEKLTPPQGSIDDHLGKEAQQFRQAPGERESEKAALNKHCKLTKREEILSLFGQIECYEACDYKRERKR